MKEMKRILALFLCLVMLVSALPVSALAAPGNNGKGPGDKNPGKGPNKPGIVETVPVTEETTAPSVETTSVTEETTAPSVETTPVTEETTAPSEETTPVTEETTAPSEETTPVTEETTPVTEQTEPPVIAVTGITLDQTALEVGVGAEPVTLVATVLPEDAADKTVTWTSSEPGVAAVADGVLTFGYMGEAVITATAGEFSATCTVTVGEGEISTYPAEDYVSAALFFSDLHADSGTANKATETKAVMSGVASNSGLEFDTVTIVGDTFSSDSSVRVCNGDIDTIAANIRTGLGDEDVTVLHAWADHDRGSKIENKTGLIYGDDTTDYYIYAISMSDMSSAERYGVKSTFTKDKLTAFTATINGLDHSKPLFIASHQPLHDRRNDNEYAADWYGVISAAAEKMDVTYFWGHNHTNETATDHSAYYIAKDGTEKITIEGVDPVVPNFTYMNAGYMNNSQYNAGSTCEYVATTVKITEDDLVFALYGEKGLHTCSNHQNVTVAREFKDAVKVPVTPETPVVPENPETPEVVPPVEDSNNTGVTVTSPKVTEVKAEVNTNDPVVQTAVEELLTNYISYDITVEGTFAEGDTAVVAVPAPKDLVNPAVLFVDTDGSTDPMKVLSYADGVVTFETTHFSTYAVGDFLVDPPATAPGEGSITTSEIKEVYAQVTRIAEEGDYVISNVGVAANNAHLLTAANNNNPTDTANVKVISGKKADGTTVVYIENPADATIWHATANGNSYRLYNKTTNRYLRRDNGSLKTTNKQNEITNWNTTKDNAIYYDSHTDRYIRYNGGWGTLNDGSGTVYIYKKQYVDFGTTTTISGTYSIVGNPEQIEQIVPTTGGTTATLGAQLTFQPQSGSATENALTSGVTYTVHSDNNGIIRGISSNGTLTFSGKTGKALILVSYDTNGTAEGGVVTNYIHVEAKEPTYEVTISEGDEVVSGTTLSVKNVTSSTTMQLTAAAAFNSGSGFTPVTDGEIVWSIPAEYQHLATVDEDGLVSFKGVDGAFYVTASLMDGDQILAVGGVNISAHTGSYSTPADGTLDFPEYPDKGSVNLNKTATPLGNNFSQTGVAEMELYMTGVPYTNPSTLDVVLMLDHSNSMTESRMSATREAVETFVNNIVKNEDGSFNGNRIYIGSFAGGNPQYAGQATHAFRINLMTTNEEDGYQIINDQAELNALLATVNSVFVKPNNPPYGTEYDQSLEECYNILNASKADGNKQFCVFMSDGIPNVYRYGSGTNDKITSSSNMVAMFDDYNRESFAIRDANNYKYEYWSTLMKNNDVTVFTVGLGLRGTNSSLGNSYSAEECERVSNFLLNDISGPGGEKDADRDTGTTVSKLNQYFFSVADANAAADMKDVFANIAGKINEAATDIVVTDKIGDSYTMVFDIPTGSDETNNTAVKEAITNAMNGDKFHIEVLNYELDANHERTGVKESLLKLYIAENENTNSYYAASAYDASNETFTAMSAPVFAAKAADAKGYWKQVESSYAAKKDEVVIEVDSQKWLFMLKGDGTHNVTSGGYAKGTKDSATNMSNDMVLVTKYFAYSAAQKMLVWTVDKLSETEQIALRYYLYLNDSATEIGVDGKETEAKSYQTNMYAYMYYTNHRDNPCQQEFPIPQLTWNGAQVSYLFYLVNTAGQPINKSGQVVDFANATFVTEKFTESVVWNRGLDGELVGSDKLSVSWLAEELLPDEYQAYDTQASYDLSVYAEADGTNIFDYFDMQGGTHEEIAASLNDRLKNVLKDELTATDVSVNTTKVYNTRAGVKHDTYGLYTSHKVDIEGRDDESHLPNFDFYNTTVAFAVVWVPALVPDTVVVDYGLDVEIDVTRNDNLVNIVSGISTSRSGFGSTAENTGVKDTKVFGTQPLTIDGNTATMKGENTIVFHQGDMEFDKPVDFYYESPVAFTDQGETKKGYMHSKVTVIPATTIYYEDSFLTKAPTNTAEWKTVGSTVNATQAQDRPGAERISETLDANNVYGYDAAYDTMSTFSMGSAVWTTVSPGVKAVADFSFWGTGFDVISLTSNTTGTIVVDVYPAGAEKVSANRVKSLIVDTYYGYTKTDDGEWVVDDEAVNALYQVPVMQITGMDYAHYDVRITASYNKFFDHLNAGSYDMYLDAIRIYDPTGNKDAVANNAYIKDGEAWPVYKELRNQVISAADFTSEVVEGGEVNGVAFIDGQSTTMGVTDYLNFGPNNELYLGAKQFIAFSLNLDAYADIIDKIHLGIKSADGVSVRYGILDGALIDDGTYGEADLERLAKQRLTTSTDMYYDITDLLIGEDDDGKRYLKNPTLVIYNAEDSGIMSLTNIKYTFTADPINVDDLFYVDPEQIGNILENIQNAMGQVGAGNAPELVDGSIRIWAPTLVIEGQPFEVTVETSKEEEKVTVNGVAASSTDGKNWTVTFVAPEDTESTSMVLTAVAGKLKTQIAVRIAPHIVVELPEKVKTETAYSMTIKVDDDVTVTVNGSEVPANAATPGLRTVACVAGVSAQVYEIVATRYGISTGVRATVAVVKNDVENPRIQIIENEPKKYAYITDGMRITLRAPHTVMEGSMFQVTAATNADFEELWINDELAGTSNGKDWTHTIEAPFGETSMKITAVSGDYSAETTVKIAPYIEAELPRYVFADEVYEIKLVVADDVTVTVNGKEVTAEPGDTERSYEVSAGTGSLAIIATRGDVSTTLDAKVELCEPIDFAVTLSDDNAMVNEAVTVTVTTNTYAEVVYVDEIPVTTYTVNSEGKRVWTAKVSSPDPGEYSFEVYCKNAEGLETLRETKLIEVSEESAAVEYVRTIVSWIANAIKGWFGW